jgi:hypothetical protein
MLLAMHSFYIQYDRNSRYYSKNLNISPAPAISSNLSAGLSAGKPGTGLPARAGFQAACRPGLVKIIKVSLGIERYWNRKFGGFFGELMIIQQNCHNFSAVWKDV